MGVHKGKKEEQEKLGVHNGKKNKKRGGVYTTKEIKMIGTKRHPEWKYNVGE